MHYVYYLDGNIAQGLVVKIRNKEGKILMIKNITISILAGLAISQYITPPGAPDSPEIIMMAAFLTFMILLWLEDIWDKRRRILRQICSLIRWCTIQIREWPAELLGRRRRRRMIQEHIRRLQEMQAWSKTREPKKEGA